MAVARVGTRIGPVEVVAVDWSGARRGARRHLWVAHARRGRLVSLHCGLGREEIPELLGALAAGAEGPLVVGLDFAFSMPGWFLDELGVVSGPDLWARAEADGEGWLAACRPPFWGRPGRRRPDLPGHLRRTEREVGAVGGIRPKSVFQVGGAGAVGTGSIRGMPILLRLREQGLRVWPFEDAGPATVVEIWPRLLTGPVHKRDPAARAAHLAQLPVPLPTWAAALAAGSEDAFDAAVSALVLAAHGGELMRLPPARDLLERREGRIWGPDTLPQPQPQPQPQPRPVGTAATVDPTRWEP